jgi:PAS domain S-box-containing protein
LQSQEGTLSLLKSVYDHIPTNVISIDLNCKIKLANYNFIRGITRKEAIGMNIFDCIHPDYHDEIRKFLDISFKKEEKSSYELQIEGRWYGARIIPERKNGDLVGYIILLDDYEDKKQAELRLKDSEEKYRTLFNESPVPQLIVDNGNIIEVNEAALNLVGATSREEIVNKSTLEFTVEEYHKFQLERQRVLHNLPKISSVPLSAYKIKRLDGSQIDVEIKSTNIIYENKKCAFSIVIDVSEKKQAEIELQNARRQLNQIQKFEAIGRLAGGIAHDFNNMLGIIQSHCDLIAGQLSTTNPVYEDILTIQTVTDNAEKLTKQLLQFSKKQTLKPEQINLNVTVRAMSSMIQRIIPKNIELKLDLEDYLKIIFVDPSQIGQVIMNLILNAIDAMPEGGELTISTQNMYQIKSIVLRIQDNGIGMDENTKQHLFEPYFTTKEDNGTGLGLATSFKIIQESGGRIEVESTLNKGSTFSVYFPYLINENSHA